MNQKNQQIPTHRIPTRKIPTETSSIHQVEVPIHKTAPTTALSTTIQSRQIRARAQNRRPPARTPPQSNPQARAGPSSRPDPKPDAQPAVPYTSIFRKNPRRAPIKRNRSTSHPPAQQPPGDQSYSHPPSQKQPRPARLPPPEPDQHEGPPPATDREARPRRTSRSGRTLIQPTKLTYLPNFAQYDTRDPSPDFRLPGPMAQKPSKPPSSTDV